MFTNQINEEEVKFACKMYDHDFVEGKIKTWLLFKASNELNAKLKTCAIIFTN